MVKTLYIQIDSNSLPEGCSKDVEVLDCRCINDFCSMVGDALVGDLKDENGKPYYRLINPVGRLLMDFKNVAEKAFNTITEDWYDILGNLLHKGQQDEYLTIKFPQQYMDWLLCNEKDYYVEIGKFLQANDGNVNMDAIAISEDIISSILMKICRFLDNQKEKIECIVFSYERIGNTSCIVKQLKTLFDTSSFIRLEQWENINHEDLLELSRLNDYTQFKINQIVLGKTTEDDVINMTNASKYDIERHRYHIVPSNCYLDCGNGIVNYLYCDLGANDQLCDLLLILYGKPVDRRNISFNDIYSELSKKGFVIGQWPHARWRYTSDKKYEYRTILCKCTNSFNCYLTFFTVGEYDSIERFKSEKGTLFSFDVYLNP